MSKIKVDESNIKQRFDAFLVNYFENKYSRNQINNAIENRYFLINEKNQKSSYKLKLNDEILFDEDKLNDF